MESPAAGAPLRLPDGPSEQPQPVGWLGLADVGPTDAATPVAAAPAWSREPPAPAPPPTPGQDGQPAIPAAALQRLVAAPRSVVPRPRAAAPSSGSPPPTARPAAPMPAVAPADPPQVLIDRIEVITPPARGPAPDPMASLVDRRTAASRHVRGGR
jgi:hypothetical protein